jgi:hypothetical protein
MKRTKVSAEFRAVVWNYTSQLQNLISRHARWRSMASRAGYSVIGAAGLRRKFPAVPPELSRTDWPFIP